MTNAHAKWLPMTGKKTVVGTDDRRCKGDFLQTIWKQLIFIPTAADILQQGGRMKLNR